MTKLDIFNLALLSIGERPLENETATNTTQVARYCESIYPAVLIDVQAMCNWAELVKTDLVSPTGKQTARGLEYNKPQDCLRIIRVNDGKFGENIEEESGFVYIKGTEGTIPLTYLRLSKHPDEWSPELRQGIVELLAARLCAPIRKNIGDASNMESNFWARTRPRIMARHLNRVNNRRTINDEDNLR